jgi:ABC-type nitrate/sulfonate/bicarbonate transport system substrate-binding protein
MGQTDLDFTFGVTPFYVTRQYYYGLEQGFADPEGLNLTIEYNHSPRKDHVLLFGEVDATTISMGKYVLSKLISGTYTLPVDPFALLTSLTYENGNGLFVHADSDVEEPADLAGKRLGIHDKSMVYTYHNAILEDRYDVPVDEIEWVFDTHQGLTTRMADGDLDAVERVGDWYWNLRTSDDHEMLYDMGEQWHELQGYYPIVHLIATKRSLYDDHPEAMANFIDAVQESGRYRDEHYEEILQAFVDEPDSASEWTGERTVEGLREITGTSFCPFTMERAQKQNIQDWIAYARRYDVISDELPEADLYPEEDIR